MVLSGKTAMFDTSSPTTLSPNFAIPLTLTAAGIALTFVLVWVGLPLSLFGIFLLYQTVSLRLVFTATDLDIYRGETIIRRFPYAEWQNWRIFWPKFPVLFYFREIGSIHFLPVLFDARSLQACLERYCPRV